MEKQTYPLMGLTFGDIRLTRTQAENLVRVGVLRWGKVTRYLDLSSILFVEEGMFTKLRNNPTLFDIILELAKGK